MKRAKIAECEEVGSGSTYSDQAEACLDDQVWFIGPKERVPLPLNGLFRFFSGCKVFEDKSNNEGCGMFHLLCVERGALLGKLLVVCDCKRGVGCLSSDVHLGDVISLIRANSICVEWLTYLCG